MRGRLHLIFALLCTYMFIFLLVVWLFYATGDVFCAPEAVFSGSPMQMANCLNQTQPFIKTSALDVHLIVKRVNDDSDNGTPLMAVYIRCDPRKRYRWVEIEKSWSSVLERYGIQLFFVVGRSSQLHFKPSEKNVLVMDFVDNKNALTEKMNGIFVHFIKLTEQHGRRGGQKVAIMLNDNIIVYPQKVVDGINEMVPRNNTQPFIGGKVAEYGDWNVTTLLKTWYKPKIFGEFISGYAVIINVEAASLLNNALEQFPITYRKRFRLDDILITWLLADSLNIQRIHTNMIGMCRQSKSDGSISWNRSLAIVHCVEIERDSIDRVIVEQNADDSTTM